MKTVRTVLFVILVSCWSWPGVVAANRAPPDLSDLVLTLKSDDGNARRQAAEKLGDIGAPDAVRLLAAAYHAEERDAFGVKAACAVALGNTQRPEAAAPLAEMLDDTDYWIRVKAVESLGKIPGEAAVEALVRALEDRDPRVRAGAVLSLGATGRAPDAVERALQDRHDRVAAAVLEALDRAGHPNNERVLADALAGQRWRVRYRAAAILARRGDPRGYAALDQAIRSENHVGVALRESTSVGEDAVPMLVALFEDPTFDDKARILDTLGSLDCVATTAFLAELAADASAQTDFRLRAVMILFDRKEALGESQVAEVAELLEERDPNLVAVALQILLDAGNPSYLGHVAPLARHDDRVIRHFSLANLSRFGGKEYEGAFVEALSAREGTDVRLALEALGRVGTRAAIPAIQPLTESRKFRRFAQAAIEAIESRE